MNLHDTHFHLDLVENPFELVQEIEKSKIYTIAITNSPIVFFYTKKITEGKKYIRPGLGLHPELAAERENEFPKFLRLIDETRYIGEVGLDNHNKSDSDYTAQKRVFTKIIEACAERKDKILTIHTRKAAGDVMSILGSDFPGKVIFHWYTDGVKILEEAIERGYYFSVNYPMILSKNGQKIIQRIPKNQLLLETDGPFTSIGSNNFNPLMVNEVVIKLDELLYGDKREGNIFQQLHKNFSDLVAG